MRFTYSKRAQDDLENLSREVRVRIIKKLRQYEQAPNPLAFAKRLHNDPEGTYRFEVAGDWRAKFILVKGKLVWITRIQHRSDAYR